MRKTPSFKAVVFTCSLLQAASVYAAPRAHHPWFAKKAKSEVVTTSSPAVSGRGSIDSTPVAAGNDSPKTTTGTQVAKQALQYKGTRYRYGGATKSGMDCSGLVARVWSDLKMKKIPRVSSALYASGKPVHLAELQPGDLVFFRNTYKRGISHVGVYAGSNKFVHAAGHSKGVTITKLSDPYYQLHYAGARRLY